MYQQNLINEDPELLTTKTKDDETKKLKIKRRNMIMKTF